MVQDNCYLRTRVINLAGSSFRISVPTVDKMKLRNYELLILTLSYDKRRMMEEIRKNR